MYWLFIFLIPIVLGIIELLSIKFGIKSFENDMVYIGDYLCSLSIFTCISLLNFSLFVYVHNTYLLKYALFSSPIGFSMTAVLTGVLTQLVHNIIMFIIRIIEKKDQYRVKIIEMKVMWLLILFVFAVYFFYYKLFDYAYSYLSVFLGYFLWMGYSKHDLSEKVQEIRSLSKAYWCCIVLYICAGIVAFCFKDVYLRATCAIIIGFLLGIVFICFIAHCYKDKKDK